MLGASCIKINVITLYSSPLLTNLPFLKFASLKHLPLSPEMMLKNWDQGKGITSSPSFKTA